MSVSCIIPCFNDLETLVPLLDKISDLNHISEIICVDGGSEVPIAHDMRVRYPHITFIVHNINLGKSASMKTAIGFAKNETLLFLDSDITQFNIKELENALKSFVYLRLDMLLLCTTTFYLFNRLSRHHILFTGIRICNKDVVRDILVHEDPSRYQWEIAVDRHMFLAKKKVAYTFMSYQTRLKQEKIGWLRGTFQNIGMLFSILTYRFPTYLELLFFFGHSRIKLRV